MKAHNPSHQEAYPPELPVTRRYTHCGDPAAEGRIQQDLARLAAGIDADLGDQLEALLLVGAYARGEGSVVERNGEASGYPGYRCILVTPAETQLPRRDVIHLEQSWARRLHVPVHLSPCSGETLRQTPPSLWWLDIARGNVEVLCGDPHVLQRMRAMDVAAVPRSACGWLLVDSALGIALSRLTADVPEVDRLRQLHTAAIACGDARVLYSGRFGGTMRARRGQLEALAPDPTLLSAYDDAITFLTRPEDWSPLGTASVDTWQERMLAAVCRWHLRFEARRLGTPEDPERFARDRLPRFTPPSSGGPLQRARRLARRLVSGSHGFPYVQDPQEVLPRAVVALAYGELGGGNRLMAARLLGLPAPAAAVADAQLVDALLGIAPEVHRDHSLQLFPGTFYGPY